RFRSELSEVVNPELFFDSRHLINALFKTFITENLVLIFFHSISQCLDLSGFENGPQVRKQNRVLARFVRTIHSDETGAILDKLIASGFDAKFVGLGESQNSRRHVAAGAVLGLESFDKVNELFGALEFGEDVLLLVLLVVFLDEGANE